MHILRWLAIEVTAKCGNMQWRHDMKDLVRKSLAERYANMQGDMKIVQNDAQICLVILTSNVTSISVQ